jgi:hypothetical protein
VPTIRSNTELHRQKITNIALAAGMAGIALVLLLYRCLTPPDLARVPYQRGARRRESMRLKSSIRRVLRKIVYDRRHARYHFIHIPKNAGEAVRDAPVSHRDVSLSSPMHNRYVDIADQVGRESQYTLRVVRNPWSRTASRFHFGRQNAARWPADDPRRHVHSHAYLR